MFNLHILSSIKLPKLAGSYWGYFTIVVIGTLLGLSLVLQGPVFTLGVILAFVLLFLIYKAPEIIVLSILLFTSGLLSTRWNPYLDLGIGHFQISDLILIISLVITIVRLLTERGLVINKTPLDFLLIFFCLSIFIGIGNAIIKHDMLFRHTTYEARIMLYYLIFFFVTNSVRTPKQLNRLLIGLFILGFAVSGIIILTVATGSSLYSPSIFFHDVLIRPFHPGLFAVIMTLLFLLCFIALNKKPLPFIQIFLSLFILITSMLLTLGRNIFVSSLLSLLVLMFVVRPNQRIQLLKSLLFILLIAILVFSLTSIVFPNLSILAYPEALFDRFVHLFVTDPMSPDETLLWRINETKYAWEQIAENPILGIGPGTIYRPVFYEGDSLQSYIHNGYLWLWLKTGLIGLISFLGFILLFLFRGFRLWDDIQNVFYKAAALGLTLIIFAMTLCNILSPFFMQDFNVAFLAVGIGITEVIFSLSRTEKINTSSPVMED